MSLQLPSILTVNQFARLTQFTPETIRRKIRAKVIKANGNPHRIPRLELLAFGVTLEDAAVALAAP